MLDGCWLDAAVKPFQIIKCREVAIIRHREQIFNIQIMENSNGKS